MLARVRYNTGEIVDHTRESIDDCSRLLRVLRYSNRMKRHIVGYQYIDNGAVIVAGGRQ